MPSVESIQVLTIKLKQKWNKKEKGQNSQLFIKFFALSGLESNYNLYRLQSY